jgi:hypothetical protein
MKKEYPDEIQMYDHVSNSGIVHMPGRRFPAVAIQGDSLSSMLSTAMELMEKGKSYQDEDLYYGSLELAERIRDHLAHYEEVLEKEGFEKPYSMTAKKIEIIDDFENS